MPISKELASALAKKASLAAHEPGTDITEIDHQITEIRIRDLVAAKRAEFPRLLADPARRERLAALLSDGAATDD